MAAVRSSAGQGKCWVFTVNNYAQDHQQKIMDALMENGGSYIIIGKEIGELGTPHLQGYVRWPTNRRFNAVKELIKGACGIAPHIQKAQGSSEQNRVYCSKEGDFMEHGVCPVSQAGSRSDLKDIYDKIINEGWTVQELVRGPHLNTFLISHLTGLSSPNPMEER